MTQFLKTKSGTQAWLEAMDITEHNIEEDGVGGFVVDVSNHVNLANRRLKNLPVQFRVVSGDFICSNNQLTSLLGAPKKVGLSFFCDENELTNLQYSPQKIEEDFACRENRLKNLHDGPQWVGVDFMCAGNDLDSLLHCPKYVGQHFICHQNPQLGDIQEITDFKKIFAYHTIELEKYKLSQEIVQPHGVALKNYKI